MTLEGNIMITNLKEVYYAQRERLKGTSFDLVMREVRQETRQLVQWSIVATPSNMVVMYSQGRPDVATWEVCAFINAMLETIKEINSIQKAVEELEQRVSKGNSVKKNIQDMLE